jgi:hypothetical protein
MSDECFGCPVRHDAQNMAGARDSAEEERDQLRAERDALQLRCEALERMCRSVPYDDGTFKVLCECCQHHHYHNDTCKGQMVCPTLEEAVTAMIDRIRAEREAKP